MNRLLIAPMVLIACWTGIARADESTGESLNARQEAIVCIAAFTSTGNMEKLETALGKGLDAELTVNEIKEILVHIHAYAGFPRALNGINTFIAFLEKRKAQGIESAVATNTQPGVVESLGKASDKLNAAGNTTSSCGCTAMLLGIGILLIVAALVYVSGL